MSYRGDRMESWLAGVDNRYHYYNLSTVFLVWNNVEQDPAIRYPALSTSGEASSTSMASDESGDDAECYCSVCERAKEDKLAQQNFESGRVYLRDGQDYIESSRGDFEDGEPLIRHATEGFSDAEDFDWEAVPRNVEYDGQNGLNYDDDSYVDVGERSPHGPHSEEEGEEINYAEDGERSPDYGPRPEDASSYYEDPAVRDERIEVHHNAFLPRWNVVDWEAGPRRPVEPPVSPMTRVAARFNETPSSSNGEDSRGDSSNSSNSSVIFLWESPVSSQESMQSSTSNVPKQEGCEANSESGSSDIKVTGSQKRKREASFELVFEFKRNVRHRSN